jgi:hypothetical protein
MASQYGARIMNGLINSSTRAMADAGEGGGRVKVWVETLELTAASANDTIYLAVVPSNARILGTSRIHWDDLASSGSPTLDLGFTPIRSGDFTADDDGLTDGLDVAAAAGSAAVVKNIADYGKRAFEYVNGQTADPKCDMYLIGTIKDAATNTTGTVTLELHYAVD